jgi:tetratricopeptide (TPR) repeat protein
MRILRHLIVVAALVANLAGGAGAAEPSVPPVPAAAPAAAPAPDSAALLDAARAKVADGDTKGAIAGLAPYVAAHPDDAAAGRLLGDIYFRIPDYSRAERVWRAVLAHVPDDHETHSRLGSLYAVEDRINDAISEFQKSLPTRTGYVGLELAHKRAGDEADYFSKLEAATMHTPFVPQVWMDLGAAREATGEYDRAVIAYQHAEGLRPTDCGPKVDLANVLVDLHQIAPAMAQLEACLKIDPTSYPATVDLGEAYLELRDAAGARPYLDRALVLRPQGCEALVDLGYIADMQGDWKTAMTYYNRALRADPLRPEPYIDLGYDYNEHRIFTLAEAAYLKGLSVAADDGRLHYLLAVTYNLQGKIALAREEYRQALDTGSPDVVGAATADLALLPPA